MHCSIALPDTLRRFIDRSKWMSSKNMPNWPHEYLVRDRLKDNLFDQLIRHIRENGYEGNFYFEKITFLDEGGLVYWTMGETVAETLFIYRCRDEETYENRQLEGTLPKIGIV